MPRDISPRVVAATRLARSLRFAAGAVGPGSECSHLGLVWTVSRSGPFHGIWINYPIIADGSGAAPVWQDIAASYRDAPPSVRSLLERGAVLSTCLDVAIEGHGRIAIGIQTSGHADPAAVEAAFRHHIALFVIPTGLILSATESFHG